MKRTYNVKKLADRLRARRLCRRQNQAEAAKEFKVSTITYKRIELGTKVSEGTWFPIVQTLDKEAGQ
jgi:transcriptional regulator with XRE-family HTH domain